MRDPPRLANAAPPIDIALRPCTPASAPHCTRGVTGMNTTPGLKARGTSYGYFGGRCAGAHACKAELDVLNVCRICPPGPPSSPLATAAPPIGIAPQQHTPQGIHTTLHACCVTRNDSHPLYCATCCGPAYAERLREHMTGGFWYRNVVSLLPA